jgi:hypothetical protein
MIARVLEGEIDAVRMTLDDAVDVVRGSVVPALRDQEGYGGIPASGQMRAKRSRSRSGQPRKQPRPGPSTASARLGRDPLQSR